MGPSGASFTLRALSPTAASYSFAVQSTGADLITHTAAVGLNFIDLTASAGPVQQNVIAGQSASFILTLTPLPAGLTFPAVMTFTCSQLPALMSCTFNPTQVAAGSGRSNVTLNISSGAGTPPGSYPVTVNAKIGPLARIAQATVTVVTSDFSLVPSSGAQSVAQGGTAGYHLAFSPAGVATFANNVDYSCDAAALPPRATCTFEPASPIPAGSKSADVMMNISTAAPSAMFRPGQTRTDRVYAWLSLPGLIGVFGALAGGCAKQRKAACGGVLFLIILMVACGGGLSGGGLSGGGGTGGGGTPPPTSTAPGTAAAGTPTGTYTVTVNATSAGMTHSAQVALTVNAGSGPVSSALPNTAGPWQFSTGVRNNRRR